MNGKSGILGLVVLSASAAVFAADKPPVQPFWSGRLGDKTKFVSAAVENKAANTEDSTKRQTNEQNQVNQIQAEPEWLKRLDKNDRTTLTGGWQLQNISGGTQSFTTAGDHAGQYAPNTYQGRQFQQWHNVATRQEIPSWNGSASMFPNEMWSQGYVSPNTWFGNDAQSWCGMSTGNPSPNYLSGGWTWR